MAGIDFELYINELMLCMYFVSLLCFNIIKSVRLIQVAARTVICSFYIIAIYSMCLHTTIYLYSLMMRVFEYFHIFSTKNHTTMGGKINKTKYLGGGILCEETSNLKGKVGILFQITHF